MNWRAYLLLGLLGLLVSLAVAQLQSFPGYLDSDYYYAGGIQLAQGRGFSEPYLWNYLDDPQGLPHPSHSYWMPLASLIAAAGMLVTGQTAYAYGRIGFLVLAAMAPVVTAALAFRFSKRRDLAITSGLLAVFSIYYAPFLPVPDNYGIYILLGGLFFILVPGESSWTYFLLGLLAGLMTLARTDGLLWVGLALILVLFRLLRDRKIGQALLSGALVLAGFLIVLGPWLGRNYMVYGTFLAPGGRYLLWLTDYDQTFIFPASRLTAQAWLAQGWNAILRVRVNALRINLLNAFAAQGGIFLFPFILIAIWNNRKDMRIRLAGLGWLALLLVMTLVFPFAGARGGFFHAGAAIQPVWWSLAPIGLESVVDAARRRNWFTPQANRIFRAALVGIAVMMTALIVELRILKPGWGEGEQAYSRIEAFLRENGARPGDVVITRNPPGYYLMTGRSAVVIPFGGEGSLLAVADRYHASYVIIEAAGASGEIKSVFDNLHSQHLQYLGELENARIFKVIP